MDQTPKNKDIRRILIPILLLLVGVLVGLWITYLPKPTITDAPKTTKEAAVTIKGKTKPKTGIVLFGAGGNALLAVTSDDKGEFSFVGVPIGEGKTTYRIRAVNSGFRASKPRVVSITKDTTSPNLSVNSVQNATVSGSSYIVSGKTSPGSAVTINGVQASVNPDGTYSATVALKPGSNTLTVTSTDAAGNSTTETQTVTYAPGAEGSTTGTATTTSSETTYSAGSQPPPAPTATSTTSGTTGGTTATSNTNANTSGTGGTSGTTGGTTAQPRVPTSITVTASVANLSPNARSTQQIFATVRDNFGNPVTNASVVAVAHFRTGDQQYALASSGSGTYVTNFKLGENAVSDFTVFVDVTAAWNGLTGSGRTSFTPR